VDGVGTSRSAEGETDVRGRLLDNFNCAFVFRFQCHSVSFIFYKTSETIPLVSRCILTTSEK